MARQATPARRGFGKWKFPLSSRFHAYDSLVNGAQRWMGHHRAIAGKNPTYLASVNGGDCTAVAHILKTVGYYTGGETDYANGMTGKKRAIDAALGPL